MHTVCFSVVLPIGLYFDFKCTLYVYQFFYPLVFISFSNTHMFNLEKLKIITMIIWICSSVFFLLFFSISKVYQLFYPFVCISISNAHIFNLLIYIHLYLYRVQSKVVKRPFSLQPLVIDVYFQSQNWFKKCKDLCYGIFKFHKSILWKLQKLTFYTVPRSL